MFRTIYWYFKFIFMLIFNYPKLKKAEKLLKNNKISEFEKFIFKSTSDWALNRINDAKAIINVFGKENIPENENVLFVSNHQSDFDIAIFMAKIPKNKGFVAKIELSKLPILSTCMKYTNCVFLDRKDIRQSAKAINKAIDYLKNGKNMVVFPEGTRSKSPNMKPFKAGTFKLAIKSNVTIIPVTINGSYKLKEGNKGIIKPATVNVYIHKPIITKNLSDEEKHNLHKTVENIVKSKLDESKIQT